MNFIQSLIIYIIHNIKKLKKFSSAKYSYNIIVHLFSKRFS